MVLVVFHLTEVIVSIFEIYSYLVTHNHFSEISSTTFIRARFFVTRSLIVFFYLFVSFLLLNFIFFILFITAIIVFYVRCWFLTQLLFFLYIIFCIISCDRLFRDRWAIIAQADIIILFSLTFILLWFTWSFVFPLFCLHFSNRSLLANFIYVWFFNLFNIFFLKFGSGLALIVFVFWVRRLNN